MKRIAFLSCALALAAGFVSCEKTEEDYSGTNYIYLSTEGNTTIYDGLDETIVVDVALTTALAEDITLDFAVAGNEGGLVSLEGTPVVIAAGAKTGQFSIVPGTSGTLEAARTLAVSLSAETVLPEGVALKEGFSFTVAPVSVDALTDEQKSVVEAYKKKTGIDLAQYIGVVPVSTVWTGTDKDSGEPLDPVTITGNTIITLGEGSTADSPVLKMVSNPMGIQDKMYSVLRSMTIENDEYWFDAEYSLPCYRTFVDAIGWTKDSDEVFSMSLDGIVLDADGGVKYLGKGSDQYGDEITVVPFKYAFTAYDRELKALSEGKIGPDTDPDWAGDCTANPAYHLNCDDISEDLYEGGNYVEASATVSETGLEFVFCVYVCSLDSDYTRVTATYTPNK